MIFKKSFLFLVILFFTACGEVTTGGSTSAATQTTTVTVALSGRVTYDFVPFKSGGNSGLDYEHTIKKAVRGAVVEIVNSSGTVLETTSTDANGVYSVTVTGTTAKIRVSAKLYKAVSSGQASWDFQVKDNTNSDALYVMEGSLANLGISSSTQTRDLNAPSGWNGSSYASTRVAGPFAILDVVYDALMKITTAQNDALFGSLDIFWSKNNTATSGDTSSGQIGTSHYNGTALFILGAANSDTDEYDRAVVAHEWGHYYEDKFSRSDNIGGQHSDGDMLDIRVAFGEGFGTAIGCMIIDSPLYIDSLGVRQSQSFGADLEAKTPSSDNPGWFNEASVYRVIYDVYDSNDDVGDSLSLGFTPIHNLFIGTQKNTVAFTSIFTFITALKAENPGNDSLIDAITLNESIAPITDIYGTGRTNRASQNANPLYSTLSVGGSVDFVTNYSSTATSELNKLGKYNFVKFTILETKTYTLNVSQIGGFGTPDPDMHLYTGASGQPLAEAQASGTTDSITRRLSAGIYRMAVIVYNANSGNRFRITLN
jgi:hypothetical protein